MERKYTGLFEDEVAELLRSAAPGAVIVSGPFSWSMARTLAEDGIYTSGAGYVVEYINGVRSGIRSAASLVPRLAHTDFKIMEV